MMVATTLDNAREILIPYTGQKKLKASEYIDSTSAVDVGQLWFWTHEWQARYQLGILELDSGNYVEFDNGDDFVASLNDLENE